MYARARPGRARLSIGLPLWLIFSLLGALTFEGLTGVSRWILGSQVMQGMILTVTAVIFLPLALAIGLVTSRRAKGGLNEYT